MTIIPAILTNDVNILGKQLNTAKGFAECVQIDFALSPFIEPSTTMSPSEIPRLNFPGVLEAHLMSEQPEVWIDDIKQNGFDFLYFHWEGTSKPIDVIKQARFAGLKVGIAINPGTDWQEAKGVVSELDALLFMTVIPGAQGNDFQEKVLANIKDFRKQFPDITIAVDGGINDKNIKKVAQSGVHSIAVGSGIWRSGDPQEAYKKLTKLIS